MEFIRYGGLSPMKQTHLKDIKEDWFHRPPKKKGFFAFPADYVELFLLGSTNVPGNPSNKSYWLKDKDGNLVESHDVYTDEWNEKRDSCLIKPEWVKELKKRNISQKDLRSTYTKDGGIYVFVIKPPRTFDYNGPIWHHLTDVVRPEMVIESKGSWVKTDMDDYEICLDKHKKITLSEMHKIAIVDCNMKLSDVFSGKQDAFKGKGHPTYVKDHLEVFIERL